VRRHALDDGRPQLVFPVLERSEVEEDVDGGAPRERGVKTTRLAMNLGPFRHAVPDPSTPTLQGA
jgi:hypothetical protein